MSFYSLEDTFEINQKSHQLNWLDTVYLYYIYVLIEICDKYRKGNHKISFLEILLIWSRVPFMRLDINC